MPFFTGAFDYENKDGYTSLMILSSAGTYYLAATDVCVWGGDRVRKEVLT